MGVNYALKLYEKSLGNIIFINWIRSTLLLLLAQSARISTVLLLLNSRVSIGITESIGHPILAAESTLLFSIPINCCSLGMSVSTSACTDRRCCVWIPFIYCFEAKKRDDEENKGNSLVQNPQVLLQLAFAKVAIAALVQMVGSLSQSTAESTQPPSRQKPHLIVII